MSFSAFTVLCNQYCCLVSKLLHHPKRGSPPIKQSFAITLWFDQPGLGGSPGEGIGYPLQYLQASLVAQMVKNLPTMQETWVRSLGWEDTLEEGMATHSSILAWRISWSQELQSMGLQRVGHGWGTKLTHTPSPLVVTTHLLSSPWICLFWMFHKWTCTISDLLWLISFMEHNVFKIPLSCSLCQYFFYGWIIFHCVDMPQFYNPIISR